MNTYEKNLYNKILKLNSLEECKNFFNDLCTSSEIKSMSIRLLTAELLYNKKMSYRDISKKIGVSPTTVSRVAKYLNSESNSGYKKSLKQK